MTCPKCKTENQNGNFCSECGEKLRGRCPECGEMEPINRIICFGRLKNALNVRYHFITHDEDLCLILSFIPLFFLLLLGLGCWVLFWQYVANINLPAWLTDPKLSPIRAIGLICSLLVMSIGFPTIFQLTIYRRWLMKRRILRKLLFETGHPKEAEILKKAEGEKK